MKICIAGATGLTGSFVLKHALSQDAVSQIVLPVRRKIDVANKKVHQVICDYSDESLLKEILSDVEAIICCIGTTIKKAGSQEAFRKVDYEIPLKLARNAGAQSKTYVLMSSVGADKNSTNFYLKTKGETEEALHRNFTGKLLIARPSLLLGNRNESRPTERISILLSPAFNLLMLGSFKRYKAIAAENVAKAMLHMALQPENKNQIAHYSELISAATKL